MCTDFTTFTYNQPAIVSLPGLHKTCVPHMGLQLLFAIACAFMAGLDAQRLVNMCGSVGSAPKEHPVPSVCWLLPMPEMGHHPAADGTARVHVRCMLWREHLQSTGVGALQAAPHYWLKLRQPRVVAWVCPALMRCLQHTSPIASHSRAICNSHCRVKQDV